MEIEQQNLITSIVIVHHCIQHGWSRPKWSSQSYYIGCPHFLLLLLIEIAFSPKQHKTCISYHTSVLSVHQWVKKLLKSYLDYIHCELGMYKDIFLTLLEELYEMGHHDSKHITLEEQVAITLYMSVTDLTVYHIGECFQHSSNMITWWVLS